MDRGSKNFRRKHYSNLNCICNCFQLIYTRTYLLGLGWEWIYLDKSFWLLFDYLSNLFYLLSNSLGSSSPTHYLQIYCTGLTRPISFYILGLGLKTCPYMCISWYMIRYDKIQGRKKNKKLIHNMIHVFHTTMLQWDDHYQTMTSITKEL